ncbi:MAG: hypothetical protein WBG38_09405 [Nodosilinea sp.]
MAALFATHPAAEARIEKLLALEAELARAAAFFNSVASEAVELGN